MSILTVEIDSKYALTGQDMVHLEWILNRLKNVHNEDQDADYMIKFREIIQKIRQKYNTINYATYNYSRF